MDNRKAAGMLLIVAAIEIVFFVLYAQHIYPNYSFVNNYISDLGVNPLTAGIFNPAIMVFGVILLGVATFVYLAGHRNAMLGFLITGFGAMCVGIFPESTGEPHIIAALITFGTIALMAIGFSKIYKGRLATYSIASGVLSFAIVIIFALGMGTFTQLGIGHGAPEELLFYNELVWAVITGYCFAKGII